MYKLKEEIHIQICCQLNRYSRSCGSYHALFDIGNAANKEATEPRVPSGYVKVITAIATLHYLTFTDMFRLS